MPLVGPSLGGAAPTRLAIRNLRAAVGDAGERAYVRVWRD